MSIDRVAALVPAATGHDCVRVAVDGVDGFHHAASEPWSRASLVIENA